MAKRRGLDAPIPEPASAAAAPAAKPGLDAGVPVIAATAPVWMLEGSAGRWPLRGVRVEVGRGMANPSENSGGEAILLAHDSVSRRHAELVATSTGWIVRDLGSTNGTRLDGVQLPAGEAKPLRDGARLEFGDIACVLKRTAPEA